MRYKLANYVLVTAQLAARHFNRRYGNDISRTICLSQEMALPIL